MISICIPSYNTNLSTLIQSLFHFCGTPEGRYELVILDDASPNKNVTATNEAFCKLHNIKFHQNAENLGRSLTRNRLADLAKGEYLLFLDCDTEICSYRYLQLYERYRDHGTVVCGGTSYKNEIPQRDYHLRYYYGKAREERSAEERSETPYGSFSSNNFMIPKKLFKATLFNKGIEGYGHEDTLFGLELKASETRVKHIDNPVHHLGLDRNEIFLEKSEKAIENLVKLYQYFPEHRKGLKEGSKLLRIGLRLKFISSVVTKFTPTKSEVFEDPKNVRTFDKYRLGALLRKF